MADSPEPMCSPGNRSMLRDFVASISTMRGDLSNVTAPPFVLDTKSTVELPAFWSQNPSIFCAPAHADDPAERALLVLKWYISSLRGQNYMGRSEDSGLKKPLNAFLGELFIAKREDSMGKTMIVSEQVSHHPPITACMVWNDDHGVSASGYTRQTITFNGAVSIKQTGHALFTLSKRDEYYLVPLPELKVRGILSGSLYPELGGKYHITSTSGYTSVIDFSGKGWFGTGSKHSFDAKVYKESDGESQPVYTVKGTWNHEFVIHDVKKGEDIETFDVLKEVENSTDLIVDPLDEQDPWETRRAWKDVIAALNQGDMKGTVDAKSKLEQGQRDMRSHEKRTGESFETCFFNTNDHDSKMEKLICQLSGVSNLESEKPRTKGVWTFNTDAWKDGIQKPYHGNMQPDNSHNPTTEDDERRSSMDSIATTVSNANSNASYASSRRSMDSVSVHSVSSDQPARRSLDIRPSSPSNAQLQSQSRSSPRRSLDGFRFPFRGSQQKRSADSSTPSPITPKISAHNALDSARSQNTGTAGPDDMSTPEQQRIEGMLRDKYSAGNPKSVSSLNDRRKSRLSVTSLVSGPEGVEANA